MPSTPTTLLRLELQGTGENTNTWGIKLNSSTIALIDSAIAGRTVVPNPLSGGTLSATNYSADQARQPVLHFSGTVSSNLPYNVGATAKWYLVKDTTTGGNITFQTTAGTGVVLAKSGYTVVAVTADGVEDARVYELSSNHVPTNPGGIVTRSSLGQTLSATGMPTGYAPTTSSQVVTYSTIGTTLSSVGMPGGFTPSNNSSVTTKAYVDAEILAALLSGTLPGQSGNAGKFLATDGSSATWSGTNAINQGRHTITTRAVGWTARTTSGATAATSEAAGTYNILDGYDFASTGLTFIQTEYTPSISYNGSSIPVTLEFLAFSTSGTVYWGVQAVTVASGGAYAQTYGSAALVSHAITGSGLRQVTAEVSVPISGTWTSGNAIMWQIYRSGGGASALEVAARLRTVNMFPTINRATDAL